MAPNVYLIGSSITGRSKENDGWFEYRNRIQGDARSKSNIQIINCN